MEIYLLRKPNSFDNKVRHHRFFLCCRDQALGFHFFSVCWMMKILHLIIPKSIMRHKYWKIRADLNRTIRVDFWCTLCVAWGFSHIAKAGTTNDGDEQSFQDMDNGQERTGCSWPKALAFIAIKNCIYMDSIISFTIRVHSNIRVCIWMIFPTNLCQQSPTL